ncbi:hypothetical protein [Solirubrobacter soli]|uniref:hypothetical protein n=1 Tax=Solirubrobacter soli TaxID=363832 RepID=UPI0004164CFD|nr:hypothetical protein [Solirubrobacter soli]
MYLVPVLLGVDADDPASARAEIESALRDHAVHVDAARHLSPASTALASFHLLVYANGIELPPAARPR